MTGEAIPRRKSSRTHTFSRAAAEHLDAVDNESAYVSALVEWHGRRWREAVSRLRVKGWRRGEIGAAVTAIAGMWQVGIPNAAALACALEDAEELRGVATVRGISQDRWKQLIARVRDEGTGSWLQLQLLADEMALGNDLSNRHELVGPQAP